ncbi:MAG: hypothetical protein Q8O17_00385, partial [Candidatus Methanoperedens sp.]|nr:hypothetical protein [Candidatus Methanoperedens sp.]
MDENDIYKSASSGIAWLKNQDITEIKDLSRSIQALSLWNEKTFHLMGILLTRKKGVFWETDKPLLDTARACSALAGCGIIADEPLDWILGQQKDGNWSNSEIETSYALITLGDAGIKNEDGCEWLVSNYGKKWEHIGTTSLIITALLKQNKDKYLDFVKDRANWILSKRESGGWTYTATSNLAIQALLESGERDIAHSIQWLLGRQEHGNWGDITSTALSLISFKMYLDSNYSSPHNNR